MPGAVERRIGGGMVAFLPVDANVAGRTLPHLGRVSGQGAHRIGHGRERPVVNLDQLGGVARLCR